MRRLAAIASALCAAMSCSGPGCDQAPGPSPAAPAAQTPAERGAGPTAQTAPAPAASGAAAGPLGVIIDFDRRVKMRDGVELSADVYRPEGAGKHPVILVRTPYTKVDERVLKDGRFFASHGYAFIAMDVRGRGDSDGKFAPYVNDGVDGYDAIEWAAAEPWSSGKVGTFGGSYAGRVQWLAAVLQPPHLTSMVSMVCPSDPFVEWPTGIPLPLDMSWHHFTAGHVNQNDRAVDWAKLALHLPLSTLDEASGRPSAAWKEMFEHPQLDAYWGRLRYQHRYDAVKAAVLHVSGWYDDEHIGTPLNFAGMATSGPEAFRSKQKLLMGPWPHRVRATPTKVGEVDFGPAAGFDLDGYVLRWFDATLKGEGDAILREPPVRLFVMGDNKWVDEGEWPIARTAWAKYYLHGRGRANSRLGDGSLSTTPPGAEPADKYAYDPADPTPFLTDASFAQIGGPDDYRAVERRDDVLVYSTEPLDADRTVCGPIKANLWAISSAKDTDFTAKLLDVWPNGFAQRLTDGMVRARFREGMATPKLIEPGRAYEYTVDLWDTCQTFKKGHAVRLEISSSAFPKYDRNLNTGEALGKGTKMQIAEQQILHDKDHPSHVVLPIVAPK